MPQDGGIQNVIVQNSYFSLPQNRNRDRFNEYYVEIAVNYPRKMTLYYQNNVIQNIVGNIYPAVMISATPSTKFVFYNNTFSDFSGQNEIVTVTYAESVSITNSKCLDSVSFGTHVYSFSEFSSVSFINMTVNNVTGTEESFYNYFILNVINGGTIKFDALSFTNNNIGVQNGIYVNEVSDKFSVVNSNFTD